MELGASVGGNDVIHSGVDGPNRVKVRVRVRVRVRVGGGHHESGRA